MQKPNIPPFPHGGYSFSCSLVAATVADILAEYVVKTETTKSGLDSSEVQKGMPFIYAWTSRCHSKGDVQSSQARRSVNTAEHHPVKPLPCTFSHKDQSSLLSLVLHFSKHHRTLYPTTHTLLFLEHPSIQHQQQLCYLVASERGNMLTEAPIDR